MAREFTEKRGRIAEPESVHVRAATTLTSAVITASAIGYQIRKCSLLLHELSHSVTSTIVFHTVHCRSYIRVTEVPQSGIVTMMGFLCSSQNGRCSAQTERSSALGARSDRSQDSRVAHRSPCPHQHAAARCRTPSAQTPSTHNLLSATSSVPTRCPRRRHRMSSCIQCLQRRRFAI